METLRVFIVRKELDHLIPEDREATRLHAHERRTVADLLPQDAQCTAKIPLRNIEKAVIVERASTADMLLRHDDAVSRGLQRLHACGSYLRMEMVVEGIRPEDHGGASFVHRAA